MIEFVSASTQRLYDMLQDRLFILESEVEPLREQIKRLEVEEEQK